MFPFLLRARCCHTFFQAMSLHSLHLRMRLKLQQDCSLPRQRRSEFRHYLLNRPMKLMGEAGDAMSLLGLARAQKIPGATETLDFDHINCANWLNKYVMLTCSTMRL